MKANLDETTEYLHQYCAFSMILRMSANNEIFYVGTFEYPCSLEFTNDKISSVIIKANTPGGSVDSLYMIQEVLSEKVKPTYGYIDGMCASCGYVATR